MKRIKLLIMLVILLDSVSYSISNNFDGRTQVINQSIIYAKREDFISSELYSNATNIDVYDSSYLYLDHVTYKVQQNIIFKELRPFFYIRYKVLKYESNFHLIDFIDPAIDKIVYLFNCKFNYRFQVQKCEISDYYEKDNIFILHKELISKNCLFQEYSVIGSSNFSNQDWLLSLEPELGYNLYFGIINLCKVDIVEYSILKKKISKVSNNPIKTNFRRNETLNIK